MLFITSEIHNIDPRELKVLVSLDILRTSMANQFSLYLLWIPISDFQEELSIYTGAGYLHKESHERKVSFKANNYNHKIELFKG